ncbi:MAG: tail fiber domain-containing protein, partial [Deltaproteobacteria bacterium]|nr:tail fiber domain-containing protein [Deltaproteobacteria bacterium]
NREVTGDIQFTQEGKAIVSKLDGVFVNLSNSFQTRGPGTVSIFAPENVEVTMDETGVLATKNYIAEQIDEVNNSGTLRNLTDTDLSSDISMIDGSLLVWDSVQQDWFDRELGFDARLHKDGKLTVKSIGGNPIILGAGGLNTSGGKFITAGGDIILNVEGGTILTLPTKGILVNKEYVDAKNYAMSSLTNVIMDSVNSGAILVWDADGGFDGTGVWQSKSITGDAHIDADGRLTVTHIGGQPINLGGELRTAGKFITYGGDITLRAESGSADLILPLTGTLATLDNVTDMIKASNLTDLNDVDIDSDALDDGQILVWDNAVAKWRNKGLSGDINLNNSDGNVTVKSIGGHPIALGGDFTTDGNVTFNLAESEANLTLPAEGVLATLKGEETFFNKIIKDSNGSFNKLSLDFADNKYGDKNFEENDTVKWVMTLKDQNGTIEWRRVTDIGAVWVAGEDALHEELAYYDDNNSDNKSLGIGFNFNLMNEDETPYPVRDNQSFDISDTGDENAILDYQLYVGRKNSSGGSIYAYGHIMAKDYYEFSDERLKENIVSMSSYGQVMDKIRNIEGVYYDWNSLYYDKNKINKKQRRQIGFIAQQLEKEFPELVQTETDGFKSVSYSKFVPALLEGVKELDERLNRRENAIFIDPDGNINLKGIVKIKNTSIIDQNGNVAANNLKVKGNIQTSNTFSIIRSDNLSSLITVSAEKKADKKVEGYISAKDVYIADKGRWVSELDSRIKIVSEIPDNVSCTTENVGEIRFVSKDSTLCICGEKGNWLKFDTSEKTKKLAASAPIDMEAFFD